MGTLFDILALPDAARLKQLVQQELPNFYELWSDYYYVSIIKNDSGWS